VYLSPNPCQYQISAKKQQFYPHFFYRESFSWQAWFASHVTRKWRRPCESVASYVSIHVECSLIDYSFPVARLWKTLKMFHWA
jgi:hypothetical protein